MKNKVMTAAAVAGILGSQISVVGVSAQELEGVTPVVFTEGETDVTAPTLELINSEVDFEQGDELQLKSNEDVTVWLLTSGASVSTVDEMLETGILWKQKEIKANVQDTLDTQSLEGGDYVMVAVDSSNNVSEPISITIKSSYRNLYDYDTLTPQAEILPDAVIVQERDLDSLETLTPTVDVTAGAAIVEDERDLDTLETLTPTVKPIAKDVIKEHPPMKIKNGTVNLFGRNAYEVFSKDITSVTNKRTYVPTYMDEDGNRKVLKFSRNTDNSLNFLNVSGAAISSYVDNTKTFGDTGESWAKDYIDFATSREILVGTASETFAPQETATRAMLVTVLGRMTDVNTDSVVNPFEDVAEGQWYTGYVAWAKSEGIVSGMSETTFAPSGTVTREQMAVMITNYFKYMGYDITVDQAGTFEDETSISTWAKDSVSKLQALGILEGDEEGYFNPQGSLTRAELAKVADKLVETVIQLEQTAKASE